MSDKIFHVRGLELCVVNGSEVPRVRDIDLAERLGFDRPRKIRDLITRLVADGEIETPLVRPTVGRSRNRHGPIEGRKVDEYWLDEEQAWHVAMHSKTPKGQEVRKLLVQVVLEVRRQLAQAAAAAPIVSNPRLERVIRELDAATAAWELLFTQTLVRELVQLDGIDWPGGSHPAYLRSTYRKIYDLIFSSEVGRELKRRCPTPHFGDLYSQHLTEEARHYFRVKLAVVEAIARQSKSKVDFWVRMQREFTRSPLQLELV